jgi:hypothetical protein
MRRCRYLLLACLGCAEEAKRDDTPSAEDTGLPAQPGPILMVSETATGKLHVLNADLGTVMGAICLTELHPDVCASGTHGLANPCLLFGVEHAVRDGGDVLTLAYTLRDPELPYAPGAVAQIVPQHPVEPDWIMTALHFSAEIQDAERFSCEVPEAVPKCHLYGAHVAVPHPDGSLMIADTSNSRLLWVTPPAAGSGSEIGTVTAVLSRRQADWGEEEYVNHVQHIVDGDSEWALLTFKGAAPSGPDSINTGRIVLWDVTDRSNPEHLWSYPTDGYLAAVHQGMVQDTPSGRLLIYAHSLGASNVNADGAGSIGLATFNGSDPPTYLGDGVISGESTLGFIREVEWSGLADALLVTDSGCENAGDECARAGEVRTLTLPDWPEAGLTGGHSATHEQQVFYTMEEQPFSGPPPLALPYDGDLIPHADQGHPLSTGRLGGCPSE